MRDDSQIIRILCVAVIGLWVNHSAGGPVLESGGAPSADGSFTSPSVLGGPILFCETDNAPVPAGGIAVVDVLLTDVPSLRAYETTLQVVRTSGTGTVGVQCPGSVVINTSRPDFVFAGFTPGLQFFTAVNCPASRATASLVTGGVPVGASPVYLSDYTFHVSADASTGSTFEVSIAPAQSFLVSPGGTSIPYTPGPVCILTVGCQSGSACNDGLFCTAVDTCMNGMCVGSGTPCGAFACNEVNDSCETNLATPPVTAPAPHNRRKNRYLSFSPNNPGQSVAFRVVKTTSPSGTCWVQSPVQTGFDQYTAKCDVAPVFREWTEPVVHVGDCETIPVADYTIFANSPGPMENPVGLSVPTILVPSLNGKLWADNVGSNNGIEWTPPNQFTNVNDVLSLLAFISGAMIRPQFTVANMQAISSADSCLNAFVNTSDVLIVVRAIAGDPYGPPATGKIIDPMNCPICP